MHKLLIYLYGYTNFMERSTQHEYNIDPSGVESGMFRDNDMPRQDISNHGVDYSG